MSRVIERVYPSVVGFVVTGLSLLLHHNSKIEVVKQLANPVITVLSINMGFLAAALTIVLTAQNIRTLEFLKSTTAYPRLIDFFWSAIVLSFLAAIYSMAEIILGKTMMHPYTVWIFHGWVFISACAVVAAGRVMYLLKVVLGPQKKKVQISEQPTVNK